MDLSHAGITAVDESRVTHEGSTYVMVRSGPAGGKSLLVSGDVNGFQGIEIGGGVLCALSPGNAATLRRRLPWLKPVPLGTATSAGFGDRLGIATPGHAAAARGTGVAPIFAQQSVRENARLKRTPQQVVDQAMWGVFQTGWREPWGADADHLKHTADAGAFIDAGYTFYTIDPNEYVDDAVEQDDLDTLRAKAASLPWDELESTLEATMERFGREVTLGDIQLEFDEQTILKALAKYGRAVAHTARVARFLTERLGEGFDLEVSVDETGTTTSLQEHFYIASELRRLGVRWVSLAPRFVGRFEKGVDYIGDLDELDRNIAGHAAVMRHFGNRYKLSLHTGSDKFGVYPIAVRHTGGLVHLKTAGTSYLEALRALAQVAPSLFRRILTLARSRWEMDRVSYHVSGQLEKMPEADSLPDEALPALLDQFDARQVLHVTFGSVIDTYRDDILSKLTEHEDAYIAALKAHFDRHLAPLARG